MVEPEIIDIGNLSSESSNIKLNLSDDNTTLKSSNFGPGIELLMNEKKKDGGSSSNKNKSDDNINIDDLEHLESELNDITSSLGSSTNIQPSVTFNTDKNNNIQEINLEEKPINITPSIGEATADVVNETKTWDGYGQFQNIPMDPDMNVSSTPKLSKEELLKEKFGYLRKLEQLEKKGVELSKKYTMDSPLNEMVGEYEMIMDEKEKSNSVKFQGNMLSAFINGVEFLNNRFDPFDVKLDGWGEQFNENVNDYDDIFAELHDKYKSKAKMAPEIKLVFQLGASAMMVHMTNTMFKSSMPNMDDIMRQNPDLMQQFNQAAVNTMGKTNPGFSGFMNNMMDTGQQQSQPTVRVGPPPAPMATQGPNSIPPPRRPGFSDTNFNNSNNDDAINIEESFSNVSGAEKSMRRPEMKGPSMKGPSDISNILSGLKTKPERQAPPVMQNNFKKISEVNLPDINPIESITINKDEDATSTVSIQELKEMQEGNNPKRSKRRQKSDKSTISLDI
uniref:Uncharacterized protein n=1 Tax=viral metagenome TaxID=1070528 RepID=A0A6C0AX77_9ZZZZ|tara:strand:- start:2102 stop:3616 length:1515 start_codon:yes stop_codon:yes gene_type:complete